MSNGYNYNDPNDIIFLPFQEDLKPTNGQVASELGTGCAIVTNEKPPDAQASAFFPAGNAIVFKDVDVDFGLEDFTIDFYLRYYHSFSSISSIIAGIGVGVCISPVQVWYGNSTSASIRLVTGNPGFIKNEWAHYALVRKEGVSYWFVNGELKATSTVTGNLDSKELAVNSDYTNSNGFRGIDAHYAFVRISNIARWTDDFIPPNPGDTGNNPSDPIDMKLHILLKVDQTVNLTGYMHPVGPNPPTLVWSSEDSTIASVDQNGTVTANAVGKTKIFVQTQDGSWSAFARIKVVEEGEDELLLSVLLEVGESCVLFPEFEPEDAATAVLWSSSDPAIATVGPTGKVTGILPGLVTITAKTAGNKLTDSMYVTVKA